MCLRGKLGLLACGFFYVNANWRFSRLRLEIVMATETRDCFGNFPEQKISKTWHWYFVLLFFFWSIICLDISVDLLIAIFMLVIVSMIENLFFKNDCLYSLQK